ncbi:MAG: 4-hydroxybenzoate octaprenyltransferase, partial [Armatimonadetes bacterium]|nr:4-hydroxybenzoate octaprenyltransferase [Armatimonadota bacterium]
PLAAGRARPAAYAAFVLAGSGLLVLAAWQFNPLALLLSPAVLAVAFGYSLTKRFTAACHYVLGLALALSPVGAWVAITGRLPHSPAPWLLLVAVACWVGGFDILYATMDYDYDRRAGLCSIPVWLGIETSLVLARLSHLAMVLVLVGVAYTGPGLGAGFAGGVVLAAVLLHFEHRVVRPDDLRRVNTAFFTLNGVLGALLLLAGLVDFAGWLG